MPHQSLRSFARYLLFVCGTAAPIAGLATPTDSSADQGELAAAIRSAGLPCSHVIETTAAGAETWRVKCNSGNFVVATDSNGNVAVTQTD
jgi:hypothetical protein